MASTVEIRQRRLSDESLVVQVEIIDALEGGVMLDPDSEQSAIELTEMLIEHFGLTEITGK